MITKSNKTKKYSMNILSVLLTFSLIFMLASCTKRPQNDSSESTTSKQTTVTSSSTFSSETTEGSTSENESSTTGVNTTTTTKPTSSTTATTAPTTAPDNGVYMDFRKPGDKNTLGVWWWGVDTVKTAEGEKHLEFCVKNNVSEIYLSIDKMQPSSGTTYADVRAFVKKAKAKGIRVAALTGDYSWIVPGNTGFQKYVTKFNDYQNAASADEKFYAMHLDVEPHQHPDFKTDRPKVMQWFADFTVNKAVPAAQSAKTILEWDIPFWLTDEVTDAKSGSKIILGELMAKHCQTITIMSYRDTAEKMYDVSVEEIAFAKKYNCKIILGAETYSKEGDMVSFMEEGKAIMASELKKLNDKLLKNIPVRNFGIAVHQIKRWYDLKN